MDELVKRLREAPNDWPDADLHYEAADAIEELQATLCNWCAVCPKDKRDLSTCEIYESCRAKPPKEERKMLKVYGYYDDLVEIEGAEYPNDEIDCFERDVKIKFKDGTEIKVGYNKPDLAIWWIRVEKRGTADQTMTRCWDEDAFPYSDILTIDSELLSVEVVPKEE